MVAAGFDGSASSRPQEQYFPGYGLLALEAFGERVRSARRQRGLTQESLGARAGLHRTYIGHIERGEVNPSLRNVLLVAQAVEVDPGDLLRGLRL